MILVTGGTGVSGRPMVRQLAVAGVELRLLVRDPVRAAEGAPESAELVRGDLDDGESVEAALEGCERALFHVEASPKMLDRWCLFEAAAKVQQVKQVVRFSAMGAKPGSAVRFLDLHGEADEMLRNSVFAWTILQPTFFMQNLLGHAATVKRDGAFYSPGGEGKAAYVDVADIAAVAVKVLAEPIAKHAGQAYPITGPADVSGDDVAKALSAALGREIRYVSAPEEAARSAMLASGMNAWNVEGALELYREMAAGRMAGVSDAVQRVTGRKAKPLQEWVRENVGAFG